jgi:hypothetical protein
MTLIATCIASGIHTFNFIICQIGIILKIFLFSHWQSRENPSGDSNPQHWDHALLLTGLDLFAVGRDGISSHQIVGLAPIGGMCTATSSCTVNEGRHFESVYVVAHEIGHK